MLAIVSAVSFAFSLELSKLQVGEFHYLPINQKPRIVDIKPKEKHETPATVHSTVRN